MSSPSRHGSPTPLHTISRYPSSSTMSSDGGYASSPQQHTSYAPPSTGTAPSYIPGVLPPGVDPSTVDFRTFYPYVPNEVKHRKRTTRAQLRILEDTFRCNTKPPMPLRQRLADELVMTPRAVQASYLVPPLCNHPVTDLSTRLFPDLVPKSVHPFHFLRGPRLAHHCIVGVRKQRTSLSAALRPRRPTTTTAPTSTIQTMTTWTALGRPADCLIPYPHRRHPRDTPRMGSSTERRRSRHRRCRASPRRWSR